MHVHSTRRASKAASTRTQSSFLLGRWGGMSTNAPAIEQHPDITSLRYRDLAGTTLTGQATGGLTLLTGLYLAISPWVVGFNGQANLAASNLVTGLALALLAFGF